MAGDDESRARNLLGDMQRRLSLGPHDALGIPTHATAADIRSAFLKLTKQYHPARFARMSPELQRLANEVFLGLRAAHDLIAKPTSRGAVPRPVGSEGTGKIPAVGRTPTPATPVPPAPARPGAPASATRPSSPAFPSAPPTTTPRPVFGQSVTPATRPGLTPTGPRPGAPTAPPTATPPTRPSSPTPARPTGAPVASPARPTGTIPRPGQPATRTQTPQKGVPVAPAATAPRAASSASMKPQGDPEVAAILELCEKAQWDQARAQIYGMLARAPNDARYRALVHYTQGREAQLAGRTGDARVELGMALEIDPTLEVAKTALGELFGARRR